MNTQELELLKKEIAYRASRRGTKELDTKFKPFTQQETLNSFSSDKLTLLKELLLKSEPELMAYLVEGAGLPEQFTSLKEYF